MTEPVKVPSISVTFKTLGDHMNSEKTTIILIHGLWMTPRSWEGWIDRYQRAGYTVLAPSWPGLEGEVEAIRLDPSRLKGLRMKTVVDHYERIIRNLDTSPILMGHSLGGIVVQMLVDRGLWKLAVEMRGESGFAPVLESHRITVRTVQVGGSNPDVDTPDDLARLEDTSTATAG